MRSADEFRCELPANVSLCTIELSTVQPIEGEVLSAYHRCIIGPDPTNEGGHNEAQHRLARLMRRSRVCTVLNG